MPAECVLIFEEAEENRSVTRSKFSSTLANKNKSRVWEEITSKVNALGVCKRGVVEVKEKGRGMEAQPGKNTTNALSHKTRQGGKKTRLSKRNNS